MKNNSGCRFIAHVTRGRLSSAEPDHITVGTLTTCKERHSSVCREEKGKIITGSKGVYKIPENGENIYWLLKKLTKWLLKQQFLIQSGYSTGNVYDCLLASRQILRLFTSQP
jgi:hypothetical protein